jgi:hypothetical protein
MYEYIFVYIELPLIIIIIKIINFFLSENFFPYFFHVHLSILDKVVSSSSSSKYGNFETALYIFIHKISKYKANLFFFLMGTCVKWGTIKKLIFF